MFLVLSVFFIILDSSKTLQWKNTEVYFCVVALLLLVYFTMDYSLVVVDVVDNDG